LVKVNGARAWQLNLPMSDDPVDDSETAVAIELEELAS
jgi:hypothetical protein